MFSYSDIRVVHLEISSRCNAACPECPRNLRGVDIEDLGDFVVHDMTLAEAKKIFPVEFLKQLRRLYINGNYGDFVTCRDALPIVQYFAESNPQLNIDISTNGSGQPKIWEALGQIPRVSVGFRIDGLEDTHHLYRQYTDFNLIMSNAQKFINAGGRAMWVMIEFDFNEHQRVEAKQRSQDMGFASFNLVNHGRNNTAVYDRDGNYQHSIGEPTHELNFTKLLDYRKIMTDRLKQNLDNHVDMLYKDTPAKEIKCQILQGREIYVQSNGEVYPCCWIGFSPRTNVIRPGTDHTRAVLKENNALEIGIEKSIDWFNELEKTWSIDSVANGRHYTCNETCGS